MFLYHGFITNYSEFFRVEKKVGVNPEDKHTKKYYTFTDNDFRLFMNKILFLLEPFYEHKRVVLIEELSEVTEISFIN